MTEACPADSTGGRGCDDKVGAAAFGIANWLSLAEAPTFVIMALVTGVLGGGQSDLLCLTAHGASPLNGMALMYGLMSVFHSVPWLRLIFNR